MSENIGRHALRDDTVTIDRRDLQDMLDTAARNVRSCLEGLEATSLTQPLLVGLAGHLAAVYHIMWENDMRSAGAWDEHALGELMRQAFRFLQKQTTHALNGNETIRGLLTFYPEWVEFTGVSLGPAPRVNMGGRYRTRRLGRITLHHTPTPSS